MKLPPAIGGIRAAFVFLTRLPLRGSAPEPEDWRWSAAHFPFVGLVLGCVMAGAWLLLRPAGEWLGALAALTAGLLATGAFHEDGLADTADALGGGYDRGRVLEILKDSRVGTFGAAALFVSLMGRTAALTEVDHYVVTAIILSQTLSRVPPIWLMALMSYSTLATNARSGDVARAGVVQAVVATIWGGIVIALLEGSAALGPGHDMLGAALPWTALAAGIATMTAAVLVCAWRFYVRVGGVTGDFLGATQQVSELALLGSWAWFMGGSAS